jgi:hypothetical protein
MTEVTLYKITRPDLTTHAGYQWVVGETREFPGAGPLCTPAWAYAYRTAQLAVLLNPIHANYDPYRLWRATGVIAREDHTKVGCSRLTLLEEVPVPHIAPEQRVEFAIRCSMPVYDRADSTWLAWAERWLDGSSRDSASATRAAESAMNMIRQWAGWDLSARAAWLAALAAFELCVAPFGLGLTMVSQWSARAAATAAEAAEGLLDLAGLAANVLAPWNP